MITALACRLACAAEASAHESTIDVGLGYEQLKLPGDEKMGLLGGSVLFPLGAQWWAGPAVYGAASGQRGGLFVGGAELQYRFLLPWDWDLRAGLFAGGGGGAAAPVGGGLMLRAAATLTHDIGPLRGGISWSRVSFPSGEIGSSQLGLVLSWERPFRYFDSAAAGQPQPAGGPTGLGFQRLAGTVSGYQLRGSDTRRIGLVGGRAEWQPTASGLYTGIEAAAAASGGAAGYMEILGNVGWRSTPMPATLPLSLEARGALGLGGGGAIPTEGGAIGKVSVGASVDWGGGWRIGLEVGEVRGLGSTLRAHSAQLWLATDLEPAPGAPGSGTISRNEWSATLQHHPSAQRKDGTTEPLDTVGIKLDRFVGDTVYLSAQAHSAFAGGAGAYSIGLIGAGLASVPANLRFGAELLLGAAGGGGVATGSGAIAQTVAWAGWSVTPESQIRVGIGAVKALRGDLRSGVLELSWTRAMGLGGR
ncbi:MAG TPA: hypothetical protein VFU71_22715 [Burkholderiaceae bacterium]|nr:hypothetical protein [Burkholderiaceae bacterium]